MFQVDLNCDLGESFGRYSLGCDAEVIPMISSANIACGFHASDPMIMDRTVKLCKEYGVSIGAHPSYPDLQGFGRRNMVLSPEEVKNLMIYQMGALYGFCKTHQVKLAHVKPHGALYNMASKDPKLADGICEGILEFDPEIKLLGLAGSELLKSAQRKGLNFASEFFADRACEEDGTLRNRQLDGAMITDEEESITRVIKAIKEGTVISCTGKEIPVQVDSVCVHGDGEKALLFVERLNEAFKEANIILKAF